MEAPSQTAPDTPPPEARVRFKNQFAAGAALVALAVVAYGPSLRGGFVWDDLVLVAKNPLVTGEASVMNIWGQADFALSTVVTWCEWLAFKEGATGYRIVNLLLHCGSGLLAWRLMRRLEIRQAWLGAALFTLHPMATASVAWISELKNTLSMPFFLLSALWYWKAMARETGSSSSGVNLEMAGETDREPRESGMGWWSYAGSLVAFLVALLAKTSTVVSPAVLLVLRGWKDQRLTRRTILSLLPHFALAAGFGGLTIYFQTHQAIRDQVVQTENLYERIADAGIAIWFYLGKALLPINLCAIYPSWDEHFSGGLRIIPLQALVGAGIISWRYRRTWGGPVLVALSCFIVLLAPVLGVLDMYFLIFARVSDHFAYLALLVVGASGSAALAKIKPTFWRNSLAGVVLAGLLALTWQRAHIYATDEALWRDTVQKNPRAWNAHNNLACNLAERGELDQAMDHFACSLQLNPRNAPAQRNYGKALTLRGRFPEAEPHFRAALDLRPDDVETLTVYGESLAQAQREAEAIQILERARELRPSRALRRQLGGLQLAAGNYRQAVAELEAILQTAPQDPEDMNNLAWLLATTPEAAIRNGAAAVALAQRACELTQQQEARPLGTLAAAYAETGDFTNAVRTAQLAIERAQAAGDESFAKMNRQLLRLYQSQRAFHLPAR